MNDSEQKEDKMEKKKKQSALSNVSYMLGIMWQGCKGYVLYTFIKEFVENVFWTVFSVYLTEWIYIAIENKTPFPVLASVVEQCVSDISAYIPVRQYISCARSSFSPRFTAASTSG